MPFRSSHLRCFPHPVNASPEYGLHGDNRPQYIEMKNFIEQLRFNLFNWGGIAAPRVVDKPIDAAVVVVDGSHSLAHCFEVGHVGYDWETVGKLSRKFLKSLFSAGKQGHLGTAIRKGGRCGQSDSGRRAGYDEYAIFDLHEWIPCISLQSYLKPHTSGDFDAFLR